MPCMYCCAEVNQTCKAMKQDDTSNRTVGPVYVRLANNNTMPFQYDPAGVYKDGMPFATCPHGGTFSEIDRADADALFIAEAYNVTDETGLTPRQLANELAKLKAAIAKAGELIPVKCNAK